MEGYNEVEKILEDILGIIELAHRNIYTDDPLTAIANRVFIIKEIVKTWKK